MNFPGSHPYWLLLTIACVMWYSTITIFVSIKGAYDIRSMLTQLKQNQDEEDIVAWKDAERQAE